MIISICGRLILLLFVSHCLQAQESRPITAAEVWARHDADVVALVSGAAKPAISDDPSWAHEFKGVHGKKVVGWDIGPKDAPVILWWHGGPGAGVKPSDLTSRLGNASTNYRHIVLDQPGAGDAGSAWVEGWRPESTADDAARFLALRGIHGPVIVSGWSWGSTMSLVFAQRHPEWIKAVVIGGVWANSPGEVARYLNRNGSRALIPGIREAMRSLGEPKGGGGDAEVLHRAIRDGAGGPEGALTILDMEGAQSLSDIPLRQPLLKPIENSRTPPDMAKADRDTRCALIEADMMLRGARGAWSLRFRFPRALADVPIVIVQGRYDLVCDPSIAVRVFDAWPGTLKTLIAINTNHAGYAGISADALKGAGMPSDAKALASVRTAMMLHFGSGRHMVDAAIEVVTAR